MTLCIAATATHEQKPAVILCHDWRTEAGDVAGGDVEDKMTWIFPNELAALMAGGLADADRLAAAFSTSLVTLPTGIVTAASFRSCMDLAFRNYRWTLIDDYLSSTYATTYAQLLGGIKTLETAQLLKYPEAFVEEKLRVVEQIPIPDCQLIVAGFVEQTHPVICVVNEPRDLAHSRIRLDKNFAAIGSGSTAALISLYRREHGGPDVSLMQAIYHVYEAKLSGEISPGVGDATSITVLFPSRQCWDLSARGHKYMYERYRFFGPISFGRQRPKLKPPFFEFDRAFFEPYKTGWKLE